MVRLNISSVRVEENLKRAKDILVSAGKTYDAVKPWVKRFKKVSELLIKGIPVLAGIIGVIL
jgi:hypothetical protein